MSDTTCPNCGTEVPEPLGISTTTGTGNEHGMTRWCSSAEGGNPSPLPSGTEGGKARRAPPLPRPQTHLRDPHGRGGRADAGLAGVDSHRDIATTQRYADYAPREHEAAFIAAASGDSKHPSGAGTLALMGR